MAVAPTTEENETATGFTSFEKESLVREGGDEFLTRC